MYFIFDQDTLSYYYGDIEPKPGFAQQLLEQSYSMVAIDTETISLKERIGIGVGIALSPSVAFYFRLFPEASQVVPWRLIKDKNILKIFQNAPFDLPVLREYEPDMANIVDTNIMARLLCYQFTGLMEMSWVHKMEVHDVKEYIPKGGTMLDVDPDVVARKCMMDAMATYKLYLELIDRVDKAYLAVEMKVIPICVEMSYKGIKLDQEYRATIEQQLQGQTDFYLETCSEIGFNPGSPPQVAYILAKREAYSVFHRLPFTRGKGKKSLSTDKATLEKMEDPLAGIVLEYRGYSKLLSTYIKPWAHDSRAYTRFHLDAVTGRPSSTDRNMQNIPGKIRKDGSEYPCNCRGCLLPDNGIWTDVDWEQLEPRVLAYLSGDKEMNHIFSQPKHLPDGSRNPGGDIHFQVAEFIGIPRKLGKTINLCVPTTTQALTLDGWKYHYELHRGDFVLGYSPDIESYIWSRIVSVMEPAKDELIQFGNGHIRLTSTRSHRWYGRQRHHPHISRLLAHRTDYYTKEIRTLENMGHGFVITLASYMDEFSQIYDTGHLTNVTPEEASIIAWLYTDGYINKEHSQAWIFQQKPDKQAKIRELLSTIPHTEDNPRNDGLVVWRLKFPWARSLLIKVGLWNNNDLVKFVLGLLSISRHAFLQTAIDAEGWTTSTKQLSISQNIGNTLDAIQLAASLEGFFTKVVNHLTPEYPKGRIIRLRKPHITTQKLVTFNTYTDYVWCMQTGIGSWVARDIDSQIFITGNAMTYGATDETLMEQSRIRSPERIRQLKQMWARKFPEAWDWIESRQADALKTGIAKTIFNRSIRLPTEDDESVDGIKRKAINFPCQGSAAEILKRGLILLNDKMDLKLQVHDELLADGFVPDYTFRPLEDIAPFKTPVEVKYLERWE